MYRSFTIKNFRGFRDFTFDSLARVNLIAGANNAGKTSLAEAIFLHCGPNNPNLARRLNFQRGLRTTASDAEDLWGWLFYGKDVEATISIASSADERQSATLLDGGAGKQQRVLYIRLTSLDEPQELPVADADTTIEDQDGTLTTEISGRELEMEYHNTRGDVAKSRASVVMRENIPRVEFTRAKMSALPVAAFLGTRDRAIREDVESFSKLEEVGRQDVIVNTLRILEPRLKRLALLSVGGATAIHADIGIGRLLPITLMGEGIGRLLSILLAVDLAKGGVVLIDEVENGLHYSVLADVWRAIGEAARRSDTQIFATTHSAEAIRAAHQAYDQSDIYDLRLHRLERVDGDIKAITYNERTLDTSVEMNLEVR